MDLRLSNWYVNLFSNSINHLTKWVCILQHELNSAYPGKTRLPVQIRLSTFNGSVYVKIPRSFRGMVVSQSWCGSTKLSDQVRAQVAYERDEGRIKRLFIGELDEADFSESSWSGDDLNAETRNGSIYVRYEDEPEERRCDACFFAGRCEDRH